MMAITWLILQRHRWEMISSAIVLVLLTGMAIWVAIGFNGLYATVASRASSSPPRTAMREHRRSTA